jgi:hypothetical protein
MRFEFVNGVKEMKRNELCVDYGKLRNVPGEKNLPPCFLFKFSPKI